jgi:hypothetical protein
MQGGARRAPARHRGDRGVASRVAAVFALGLFASGCVTGGSTATHAPMAGSTVAFESVDGPPAHVFRKYVEKLSEEAEARKMPVVSRETPAPYRIRGYLALGIEKKQKRTVISWVWDVYDSAERRAFRISGEEIAGPAGRDPWAAANDEALSRVARAGMERLAAYFQTGTVPAQPGVEPHPSAPSAPERDENPNVAGMGGGRHEAAWRASRGGQLALAPSI